MLYWRLWHGALHLAPWRVDRMTLTEVCLALDDDTQRPRPATGARVIDPWSVAEFIRRRRRQSLRERVDEAKAT